MRAGTDDVDTEVLTGVLEDLCAVLGLDPNRVNRISIQPGYLQAELWEDDVEPVPGRPGVRRRAGLRGWTFPLPVGHRLRYRDG